MNLNIQTLEQQIIAEYGAVTGFIATHAKLSVVISFLLGAGLMWLKTKI